jgi:hypothetical protein
MILIKEKRMIGHKDVRIEVYSFSPGGGGIEVLNAEGDRVLFEKGWFVDDDDSPKVVVMELLKFLGYTVHHEEVY